MNIALEQTEEHVNGRVTNRYGDAFIRGNNGEYMHDYSRLARFSHPITSTIYLCRRTAVIVRVPPSLHAINAA